MSEQDKTNLPEEGAAQGADNAAVSAEAAAGIAGGAPAPEGQPVVAGAAPEGEPTQAMPVQAQPEQSAQPAPEAQPTQPMAPGQVPPTQVPPAGQPYPAPGASVPPGAPAPGSAPSATPALICGILAIVFCWIPIVGIVLGIVAIVLAGKYFKAVGVEGSGKAGRICGIVGLVLSGIMIVVYCIAVFTMITALNEADVDITELYAAQSSSSAISSSTSSGDVDADDQAIYDAVDPELDKIKNLDPAMVATIAAIIQESLDSELVTEDLSLATLQIDATELAKAMLAGFDYEYYYAISDGDEGEACYTITCKDKYAIMTEFEDQIDALIAGDASQYTTMESAYAAVGQALMAAIDATPATDDVLIDVDVTKVGGTWTMDADSWTEELEDLFEL